MAVDQPGCDDMPGVLRYTQGAGCTHLTDTERGHRCSRYLTTLGQFSVMVDLFSESFVGLVQCHILQQCTFQLNVCL